MTTIASALKQLKFDVAQANQAVYGHKCTISPTRKIMLQAARGYVRILLYRHCRLLRDLWYHL